jgi:DNA-binding NtrC family response regulator
MNRILIFDAYPSIRELLAEELAGEGNTVAAIANPDLIADLIITFDPDLFILEPYIRGSMMWEMLDSAKRQNPNLPILLFTQWSGLDSHFSQAEACLPKSYILDNLKRKVKEIMERRAIGNSGSKDARFFKVPRTGSA